MYKKTRKKCEPVMTDIDLKCIELANYIIENKATVRAAAKHFGIAKSYVHKLLVNRLQRLNRPKYYRVRKILDYNKSVCHIHGGDATKRMYAKLSQSV